MDDKTLKALKESIAHWERMRDGTQAEDEEPEAECCALCQIFLPFDDDSPCQGCPVHEHTGRIGCNDTPYQKAYDLFGLAEFRTAAQAEIDFLKSLLPKEET